MMMHERAGDGGKVHHRRDTAFGLRSASVSDLLVVFFDLFEHRYRGLCVQQTLSHGVSALRGDLPIHMQHDAGESLRGLGIGNHRAVEILLKKVSHSSIGARIGTVHGVNDARSDETENVLTVFAFASIT